eukprot:259727-Chlamydomonas_euryale.AAC.3
MTTLAATQSQATRGHPHHHRPHLSLWLTHTRSSPQARCTALKELHLSFNKVSDVRALPTGPKRASGGGTRSGATKSQGTASLAPAPTHAQTVNERAPRPRPASPHFSQGRAAAGPPAPRGHPEPRQTRRQQPRLRAEPASRRHRPRRCSHRRALEAAAARAARAAALRAPRRRLAAAQTFRAARRAQPAAPRLARTTVRHTRAAAAAAMLQAPTARRTRRRTAAPCPSLQTR